ncbi:MAG: hypothetical protein WCL07_03280 [bacterium]
MKKIKIRYFIELGVTVVVAVIAVSSYLMQSEGVLGKNVIEIVTKAGEQNDYELAQRLYEHKRVLGTATSAVDIETLIYPERKIAQEISRLEGLATQYPTYPPLLLQLAKLNRVDGNEDKVEEYEKELARLKVTY